MKPVLTYTGIAYIITWTSTIILYYLFKHNQITLNTLNIAYNFGALGPFIAALICARTFYGANGIKKLFGTFSFKNLKGMSLFISLSPLLFFVISFFIYPLITGHIFTFSETKKQFNLTDAASYAGWIIPFITYSFFEEFGWRGFLLPHLQEKYSAFKSTFILTCFWAGWHVPFFLWRFQFSWWMTIGFFFGMFVGAIIITCTYNLSRGNIMSVILFHLCNNVASSLDKEYIVAIVSTCFIFLAVFLIKKYKPENLADTERVKNFYLNKPARLTLFIKWVMASKHFLIYIKGHYFYSLHLCLKYYTNENNKIIHSKLFGLFIICIL